MMRKFLLASSFGLLLAAHVQAAVAAPDIETLIAGPTGAPAVDGRIDMDILFANQSTEAITFTPPQRFAAEFRAPDRTFTGTFERMAVAEGMAISIPAGGFQRLRYRLTLPGELSAGTLAVVSAPSLRSNSVALIVPERPVQALAASPNTQIEPSAVIASLKPATSAEAETDRGNAFLAGLSAYEPIYALLGGGPGTNAKLQFSFKYQLFGEQGVFGGNRTWLDGLQLAYTQRMYWDLATESIPFRNIDFQPELIYLLQTTEHEGRPRYGVQLGLRHESNGRGGDASRSVNTAYIQPSVTLPVGRYELLIGPRAWFYYGGQEGNEDIEDFRGYTGLALEIGEDDGLRLGTFARYNFDKGNGSVQADISYPLNKLVWDRLNLYLYGQAFVGYGENLFDYDRRMTRFRIGIGIVR